MTAQYPNPPHPIQYFVNQKTNSYIVISKAGAGNIHYKRNSTLGSCIPQIQNLTTDEHYKYHPLKLYKNKAGEPLQMQQQPVFIAQICQNSKIIEKVNFGRSPQDITFPSNNPCYSVSSPSNIVLKSTNFNDLENLWCCC